MRIAVAEISQETDSFSPMLADLSDFQSHGLYFGDELLERMQGVGPIGGFLEVVEEEDEAIDLLPIVRAWATASGRVTDKTVEFLLNRLLAGLAKAMPLDAIFLSLHGAASSQSDDDLEGHVLQAIRQLVGTKMPIVSAVDHHANITGKMVELADALIGHETQPHDPFATGRKAARVLLQMLRGVAKPTIGWRKIPLITPQDQFLTSRGPMKEWFDRARELENRVGVIDISPYPMQPWLDVAEGGWSIIVHTDGDQDLANSLASEMAEMAWQRREQFWHSERVEPAEAVRQAIRADHGLVVLSDTGDSVYGGAPGDSTCILRELLEQNIPSLAFLPILDPAALEQAMKAGVGGQITVPLGGKIDSVFSQPVSITGRVAAVSKGVTVELEKRGTHDLSRTALLEVGNLRIVLLDHRSFAINHPVVYTHLGLDITEAKLVVLKTASNFQFFQRWCKQLIRVDSPGTTQSNLAAFEWSRLPRPIYPLDKLDDWRAM